MKVLSQVAGEAAKLSPPQSAAVRAEAESAMSLWEKIKSLFSRKQAQNKAEVASVDTELEAAVGKYILAENSNIFDSLFNKIKNVADKDINIAKHDFASAKKDFDSAKSRFFAQEDQDEEENESDDDDGYDLSDEDLDDIVNQISDD